jgi:hypothetical protein
MCERKCRNLASSERSRFGANRVHLSRREGHHSGVEVSVNVTVGVNVMVGVEVMVGV